MQFGDYVKILKAHFKEKISNEELCLLLFDSIIQPLDLRNPDGEILTYSKGRISEFINGKASIPQAIQDGYNSDAVINSISDYFDKNIVSMLAADLDDLCYQLMSLIEADNSISPISKSNLRQLANSDTASLFLAQTFGYSIRRNELPAFNNKKYDTLDSSSIAPVLSLAGIIDGEPCLGSFTIDNYELITREEKLALKAKTKKLFYKAAAISLPPYAEKYNPLGIINLFQRVTISEDSILNMKYVAEGLDVELPDGFFNLGNLEYDKLSSVNFIEGGLSLRGDDIEKRKFRAIKELEEAVNEIISLIDIDKGFLGYKSVSLAVCNTGTMPDEKVNVTITIPSEAFVSIDDILKLDNQVLEDLLYKRSSERFFYIKRTQSVLDFDESITGNYFQPSFHYFPNPLGNKAHKKDDFRMELESIFPYFITTNGNNVTISFEYDEVLHKTNVAFPSVILLNKEIDSISYSIRSRHLPDVLHGSLKHK